MRLHALGAANEFLYLLSIETFDNSGSVRKVVPKRIDDQNRRWQPSCIGPRRFPMFLRQLWGGANGLWETGQMNNNMGLEEGSLHPCTEGHHPPPFFSFKPHTLIAVSCIKLFNFVYIFLLSRLKIKHVKELQNSHLLLGLLAWLQSLLILSGVYVVFSSRLLREGIW